MFNQDREKKVRQIKIIIAFIFLFIIIGFLMYLAITPPATCSDGKKNQGEAGIDCGGPCGICKNMVVNAGIAIKEIALTDGGNGTFDAVAKVFNPNDASGAKSFTYTFTLKDEGGNVVATKEGISFILPLDTKYIAQLGIETKNNVSAKSAELKINDVEWATLNSIQKPQLGVYNKIYQKQPLGDGSIAQGVVRNESGYDLNKISIVIILRDISGKIIGVNSTEKNMVRAGEQQEFRLSWPYSLGANVQNMDVDAQSNVLDPADITLIK